MFKKTGATVAATKFPRAALRKRSGERHYFEALEGRQLMAGDFTGAFTTLPSASLTPGGTAPVTFSLSNAGDTRAAGRVAMDVYLVPSSDLSFDPTTTELVPFRVTRQASLLPGVTQTLNFNVPVGNGAAPGTYSLVAVIDPQQKLSDADLQNNIIQSAALTVTTPGYDVAPTIGTGSKLASSIVTGAKSSGTVSVLLTNPSTSTTATPKGAKIGVTVVARPVGASDASQDVVLSKAGLTADVSNLGVNKSKRVNVPVTIPTTLTAGEYSIIVLTDTTNVLTENDETNNAATLQNTLLVGDPASNLALTVNSKTKLPTAGISGAAQKLPVTFDITNVGNTRTAARTTGTLVLTAHPVGGGEDIPIQTFSNIQLSGLANNAARTVTVTPTTPADLPAGEYSFVGTLLTGIATDLTTDNTVTTADAGLNTVNFQAPFVAFSPTITTSTIGSALVQGVSNNGKVGVRVVNSGNTAVTPNQRANVTVALRPVDAADNTQDIQIGTLQNQNFGNLAAGSGKNYTVQTTIPQSTVSGDYELVTTVTPVGSDTGQTFIGSPVTIGPQFNNVSIANAATTYGTQTSSGAAGVGTVRIQNLGNVASNGSATVTFYTSPTGLVADAEAIGSKSFTFNLKPNQTTTALTVPITLPSAITSGTSRFFATITPTGFTDTVSDDNTLDAGSTTVALPGANLQFVTATNNFGTTANGGATGLGTATLSNIGTLAGNGNVTVNYFATTADTLDDTAIPIGTATIPVTLAAGATSFPINVNLALPTPTSASTYNIFATVTSGGFTDVVTTNNTLQNLGAVFVSPLQLTPGTT